MGLGGILFVVWIFSYVCGGPPQQTTTKFKPVTCPFGYIRDNVSNICYVNPPQAYGGSTWQAAYNICLALGTYLPKFVTLTEFTWFKQFVDTNYPGNDFWIGMISNVSNSYDNHNIGYPNSTFKWYDGTDYYQNGSWGPGEPDDDYGQSQICVGLYTGWNHLWDGYPCYLARYYLCQCRPPANCISPFTTSTVSTTITTPQSTSSSMSGTKGLTTVLTNGITSSTGNQRSTTPTLTTKTTSSSTRDQTSATTTRTQKTNSFKGYQIYNSTTSAITTSTTTKKLSQLTYGKIATSVMSTTSPQVTKSVTGFKGFSIPAKSSSQTTTMLPSTVMKSSFGTASSVTVCDNAWSSFADCSVSCGSGNRTRIRTTLNQTTNACSLETEYEACDQLPCNPTNNEWLEYMMNIFHILGCTWILLCLVLTVFFLGVIRSWDVSRAIQLCEEVSLFLCHIMILTFALGVTPQLKTLCTWISILIQYFYTVHFCFILLETIQIYAVVTASVVVGGLVSIKRYMMFGWGVPLIPTVLTAATSYDHYVSDFSCWLNLGHSMLFGTMVPIWVCVVISVIVLEATGQFEHSKNRISHRSQLLTAQINQRGLWFVLPCSVASWFLGLFAIYYQKFFLFPTVFKLHIHLGIVIFFFHALGNCRVRELLGRLFGKIKSLIKKG